MLASRAQRAVVLIALALAIPVLAGCGMEAKDETSKEHSQIQAASNHIGAVRIRNAFITTLSDPTSGAASTYLVVTLLNRSSEPDALTGVTSSLGTVTLNSASDTSIGTDGVTLPPHVLVQVSNPELHADAPTLELSGTAPLVGTFVPVSFSFANAGTTGEIQVPVVSAGGSLSPTQQIPTDAPTFSIPIE